MNEIKMELVNMVNKAKETEIRETKAKQYCRSCKRKEIKYYIALILIILGIGFVGTMEMNATPERQREIQAEQEENYYPTSGIVTAVGKDFMVFTDFNGNQWTINNDPEDWICGDIVSAIMDKNGTEIIYDDEVVSTKYSGWIY